MKLQDAHKDNFALSEVQPRANVQRNIGSKLGAVAGEADSNGEADLRRRQHGQASIARNGLTP